MGESDFRNHKGSKIWIKIRLRYCILKALVSAAKSKQELLSEVSLLPEFLAIKNSISDEGELPNLLDACIKELIVEKKIKQRDIFNTRTKERRIEWFLNPEWLSQTRLFKVEIKRVREIEEKELKAKAEQDRAKREKEERERREQMEKINRERQIKLNHEQSSQVPQRTTDDRSKISKSNSNDIFNGILSLVAVLGGIYVVGKIGDSLSKAFTFPVFIITCLVAYSIYHLSRSNDK